MQRIRRHPVDAFYAENGVFTCSKHMYAVGLSLLKGKIPGAPIEEDAKMPAMTGVVHVAKKAKTTAAGAAVATATVANVDGSGTISVGSNEEASHSEAVAGLSNEQKAAIDKIKAGILDKLLLFQMNK